MPKWQYFRDQYSLDDFTAATDTSLTDDEYRTVERLELEKGEAFEAGQGLAANQTDAVGRIYVDANNSGPSALSGKMRLVVENTQNNKTMVLYQNNLANVNSGASDPAAREPFPHIDVNVKYPYKVALQIKLASGTDTYSSGDSTVEFSGWRGEEME
jgi:hypothetical protein